MVVVYVESECDVYIQSIAVVAAMRTGQLVGCSGCCRVMSWGPNPVRFTRQADKTE